LGVLLQEYEAPGGGTIIINGSSIFDFAGPPVILVNIDPIFGYGSITNGFGTHAIALQNTASFGDRIFYTNTQRKTCATIFNSSR